MSAHSVLLIISIGLRSAASEQEDAIQLEQLHPTKFSTGSYLSVTFAAS